MSKDLTSRIVRLDAFEERVGVRLEGVTAELIEGSDSTFVKVFGELYPLEGASLSTDIQIYVSLHGENGQVLAVESDNHSCEEFFGFAPFSIILSPRHGAAITSVKVYPR